jgi:hypothetical protein
MMVRYAWVAGRSNGNITKQWIFTILMMQADKLLIARHALPSGAFPVSKLHGNAEEHAFYDLAAKPDSFAFPFGANTR